MTRVGCSGTTAVSSCSRDDVEGALAALPQESDGGLYRRDVEPSAGAPARAPSLRSSKPLWIRLHPASETASTLGSIQSPPDKVV